MKILNEDIFIKYYPHLDLHGIDTMTAKLMVHDFINDNYKLGNHDLAIIHGLGTGAVKKAVQDALRVNKKVINYKVYVNNVGVTIVKI